MARYRIRLQKRATVFVVNKGVRVNCESVGSTLKEQRERKGISLLELSRTTRIPVSSIEAIEVDAFDLLPGEVFARGFLKSYALEVGIEPDDVLSKYKSSREAETALPLPAAQSLQPVNAPPPGRRFGVAIAFVLFMILFTLALSIVLKPRGHDMPSELSERVIDRGDERFDPGVFVIRG